jgi:hypothetical protein
MTKQYNLTIDIRLFDDKYNTLARADTTQDFPGSLSKDDIRKCIHNLFELSNIKFDAELSEYFNPVVTVDENPTIE